MTQALQLAGVQFGRLTAISPIQVMGKRRRWECRCECGAVIDVAVGDLMSRHTRSCGCLQKQATKARSTTHGMSRTRIYKVWQAMWWRCTIPSTKGYENYGGRGITVCERWRDFALFLGDMGIPERGKSIDRKDNDGNYEPENCRWATKLEQMANRRIQKNSIMVEWCGKKRALSELVKEIGIPLRLTRTRIMRGWSVARALTT